MTKKEIPYAEEKLDKMNKLLSFLSKTKGKYDTLRQLGEVTGIGHPQVVVNYLSQLEKKGYLEKTGNKAYGVLHKEYTYQKRYSIEIPKKRYETLLKREKKWLKLQEALKK